MCFYRIARSELHHRRIVDGGWRLEPRDVKPSALHMLKIAFFDLDDTLYPLSSGVMHQMSQRINAFVAKQLNINTDEAAIVRKRWRERYGTALRGLMEEGHAFDRDHFFEFVHNLELEGVIFADPKVREMLLRLPVRRAVLTNSNIEHATRVLKHLNLEDCFERVIDIKALEFINKPYPEAYQRAINAMNARAENAMMIEDSIPNAVAAKKIGMTSVLIAESPHPEVDYTISHLGELEPIIQKLARQ